MRSGNAAPGLRAGLRMVVRPTTRRSRPGRPLRWGPHAEEEHGGKIDWVRDPAVGLVLADEAAKKMKKK